MKIIKFLIVSLISFALINFCSLKSMANEYENDIQERLIQQRAAYISKQNAVKSNTYGSLLYKGKGFDLYYSLNSYGTISISIYENENSYLYFDSIYRWNLDANSTSMNKSSGRRTIDVQYLGTFNVCVYEGNETGVFGDAYQGYTGYSYKEKVTLYPIISSELMYSDDNLLLENGTVFAGDGLYVSGCENIEIYMESPQWKKVYDTDCMYSGPYYHELIEPGSYFIKTYNTPNDYSYYKYTYFDVVSNISGIKDGETYPLGTEFEVIVGTAEYNGTKYDPGVYKLNEVGIHKMSLSYKNYSEEISFIITPDIFGIKNGGVYIGSVTPSIKGGAITLDGQPYDGLSTITEVGNHTIKITGINGYEQTINFTIDFFASGISNNEQIIGSASLLFSGGTAKLDSQPYASGQTITEVGHHTIDIYASTGYRKTINFTILPDLNSIQDGQTYSGSVTPKIEGGAITLDSQPYDGVSVITEVGHHTIVITGSNGYSETITFTILPKVSGIQDGQTYSGSATPKIEGGAITLDGKSYDGVSTITEPGAHVIKITGLNGYEQEIKFTIDLVTSGIENGAEYYESVSYDFSGGTATLDGQPYISGQTITEVGHHTIIVTGSTGYSETIIFTILPKVSGIQDGQTYSGSVTPKIEGGTITLDGKSYDGVSTITEPGEHTIKIVGSNGYEQEINFTIDLVTSGISDNEEVLSSGSLTFSGGTATIDGQPYTSGQIITEVGYHTIIITGLNGYSKTINFTILPSVEGIEDGKIYSGSVTPNIEGGTITLDGKPYDGVSKIIEPGEHTIKIVGSNGYEQEIKFTIGLVTSGIENGAEYYESVSYDFSGGTATLDGKPYTSGQIITEVGHHTIVITGSNGYSKTINFTIKAVDYTINSDDYSWEISINDIHPNTTVTIDGKEISGSYSENAIGNHTLIITNGDYEEVINFTIKENLAFNDGDVFTKPLVIEDINGQVYVDGVLVEDGYRIDQNGTHEIKIVGTNGYESIIIIEYRNPNYLNAFMMLIPISMVSIGIIYMAIRRRRVI